jgi:hypothetical protein
MKTRKNKSIVNSWKGKENNGDGTFKYGSKDIPYSKKFENHLMKSVKKRKITHKDDYCSASSSNCKNSQVWPRPSREAMPQFENMKMVRKFDRELKKLKYSNKNTTFLAKKLKASQREINKVKINEIADRWREKAIESTKTLKKILEEEPVPILITNDGSIVDGHHRAFAIKILIKRGDLPPDYMAPVHMYNAPIKTVLMIANSLGYNSEPQKM